MSQKTTSIKKHAVLELKRLNTSLGKLSHGIYQEKLKKERNPAYVKKSSWEIIKIITKEGVFFPKTTPPTLLRLSNSKQKIKQKSVSKKRKINLSSNAKQRKAQVA